MIATFACVVVCLVWMVFIIAIYGQLEKPPKKLSFYEAAKCVLITLSVPILAIWIRIAHPDIFFWMGLIFLFLALITTFGAGMKR